MSGLTRFLMHEVELPLIEVVAAMEDVGFLIDVQFFHNLRRRLEPELQQVQAQLSQFAAAQGLANFNPASPNQLAELLFGRLRLPVFEQTKSGAPSTSERVLKRFEKENPVVRQLLRFRELNKVIKTYCTIPNKVNPDGRLRVEFNQLAAQTGRFSSSSIIQTLPKSDEFGIRNGFRAPEGWLIVKVDFKQQELRVLAQVSGDKNMLAAILKNIDLHGLAAVKVYRLNCAPNEVEQQHPVERESIKAIQFGLIYGRSAYSLAQALGIANDEAQQLIDDYFKQFPAVKKFIDSVHTLVKNQGYVDDLFGRRRYFPNAALNIPRKSYASMSDAEKAIVSKVAAAKRAAQNFVIQGASATITKLAMIRCHRRIAESFSGNVKMNLTLHDELQFEVRKCVVADFASELPGLMCDLGLERFGFTVPMAVDIKVGPSWGEAKKWKGSLNDHSTKG